MSKKYSVTGVSKKSKADGNLTNEKFTLNPMRPPDKEPQVILLIGKTGSGKSSTGNTILEKEVFKVSPGIVSETRQVTIGEHSSQLKVVDIPDICVEGIKEEKIKSYFEDLRNHCSRSPVVLVVIRADERYTPADHEIYQKTVQLLGEKLKKRMIVAFTMTDHLVTNLEEDLKTINERLKGVLEDACGRYVVFNNVADQDEKNMQVHALKNAIKKLDT